MRATLIAVGEKMPSWVTAGYNEYVKRLSHELPLQLVEVTSKLRGRTNDAARVIADEGTLMLAALAKGVNAIALDGRGKQYSSEQLAEQLARWRMGGRDIAFLVGGPEGLAPAVRERANQCWSLGPATLPHPLVRILIAEQLYRAASLLGNHPYHRG
ncbi:MAG: 23S rRNA (pseudouridine(1915)-N(3))-methyltransferase RlmH [Proteobacteria bacterium]|uniref:23S rRNA (pseudouridine(1915)-N(3))-methyltransferase RlmH n=1 Tax=Rudaea sp. TaxID=2136325 RepID=UPI001D2D9394|nr:23S rRNA (pseudouridine(1915)-N(3))-methyltransferase RlmH [Pseudomonadota bacterium]MBS0568718.1 23S rRNA (pseudouridine(1915)-N(3))-methyltransferase RlmH [Pseudomonadota bacterium]